MVPVFCISFQLVYQIFSLTCSVSVLGVTLTESGHAHTSQSIVSCHFSSDGKWLASAGHDKQVVYLVCPDNGFIFFKLIIMESTYWMLYPALP